ncbi:hypothetical protein E1B28_008149 [Marasmius oreades]|uniref:Protein kinase domain-containing protein n=1 Tax=Marasmius oreades TaxID=181124 RepID=A0A9P7RYE6_9AGAR|nr:uncharacterized protein E1B28_008149 [Marasmius oreades]KAG7091748.1 hypothetical protein E1B28_008149 [Marasmius oreades]
MVRQNDNCQKINRRLLVDLTRGTKFKEVPYIVPKFKKFCADIKQQPLEDYAEDLDPDLTIQEALEVNPSCVTFLAKKLLAEDSGPDDDNYIVIKFARRYNKEAHVMMGELGFALKLLGYCPLRDGESPYDNLVLLAMEYVEGGTLYEQYENRVLPTHVKRDVQEALQVLNGAGYIFADLRRPNLIVRESDGKVLLIDFDWVCRVDGGMRYPFHLSQDVKDRSGAKDNEVISLKHQEGMFEKL